MKFTIRSTRYEIPEFFHKFRKELPKLVMVTDGGLNERDGDTFEYGQIIRFHTCSEQRRVKATAIEADGSQGAVYSIPLDYPNPLFVCEKDKLGKDKVWKPHLLKYVVENHKLPLAVQFASPERCEESTFDLISAVTLTEGFDEVFLLGNAIDDGRLNMGIISLSLKRNGMTIALINGIQDRTTEEFNQYCTELTEAVTSSISFCNQYGPAGIKLFDPLSPNITISEHSQWKIGHLIKMLSQHVSLPTQKAHKERTSPSFSPNINEGSCGNTNAELHKNLQSSESVAEIISNYYEIDDINVHYKCEGKIITTVTDVTDLLKRLKLDNHVIAFKDRGIDGKALFELSERILEKEYNFNRVEIVKLMSFVRTGHIPS